MKKYILLGIFALAVFSSCTKEYSNDFPQENNPELGVINMMTFDKVLDKQPPMSRIDIVIVSFDGFGRSSQNCFSGFGLCDVVWFPAFRSTSNSNVGRYGGIVMTDAESGKRYMDIFLAELPVVPFQVDGVIYHCIEDLRFIIDEDIVLDEFTSIKAGVYLYDSSLGEFGGYRVFLR